MKNLVIYLNAGHGNFENGKYHTFAHDGKFYHFTDNRGKIILSAYEGQTMRMKSPHAINIQPDGTIGIFGTSVNYNDTFGYSPPVDTNPYNLNFPIY